MDAVPWASRPTSVGVDRTRSISSPVPDRAIPTMHRYLCPSEWLGEVRAFVVLTFCYARPSRHTRTSVPVLMSRWWKVAWSRIPTAAPTFALRSILTVPSSTSDPPHRSPPTARVGHVSDPLVPSANRCPRTGHTIDTLDLWVIAPRCDPCVRLLMRALTCGTANHVLRRLSRVPRQPACSRPNTREPVRRTPTVSMHRKLWVWCPQRSTPRPVGS